MRLVLNNTGSQSTTNMHRQRYTMKTQAVLLIAIATSVLSIAPTSRAEPSVSAKKRAQISAIIQDQDASRLAFREMMKDRDKKHYMVQAMAHDPEAREFFNAEVGSDAPHQERNPSQHPELFRPKQP